MSATSAPNAVARGWKKVRLGYLVDVLGGLTPSKEDLGFWGGDIPWVSPKDMKSFRIRGSLDKVSDAALRHTGLRLLPLGSVLIVTRGMILDHTVPVGITRIPVTINQDMKALVARRALQSEFLAWSMLGHQRALLSLVEVAGHGTCALRTDQWSALRLPVPPLEEQTQIAKFLDYETAKIDALIEKQQQLIALLKEKRQAVISHAVTKGLNPDAPMRDSGVEWLGEVPAHWTVSQIKQTWRAADYGVSESAGGEGEFEMLTMGDIQGGEVLCPRKRFLKSVDPSLLLEPGDLLFNRTNSLALVGKVGLFRGGENVTFASYCVRLRLVPECLPEFFNFLLNSEFVLSSARASSFPSISQTNLNPTRYGALQIAVPAYDEQVAISSFLSERVEAFDAAVGKAEAQVDLLAERRTALISAAVTGKIDVRTWTPPTDASA